MSDYYDLQIVCASVGYVIGGKDVHNFQKNLKISKNSKKFKKIAKNSTTSKKI